jgi:hypothetical protein
MKRSIGLATAAGFLVGSVWVTLAFVFFTVPQSSTVDAIKLIATITCPPFLVPFCAATGVLSGANGVSDPSREGIHVPVNRPAEHVNRVPEQRYHPVAVGLENAFRV